MAIDIRSVGNAGQGPSSILGWRRPGRLRIPSSGRRATKRSLAAQLQRHAQLARRPCRIMRRSAGAAPRMVSSPPVTAASAMKLPISMWSGPMRVLAAAERRHAVTIRRLVPMPSIVRAHRQQERHRSWTCGSQAALRITVAPLGAATAAIRAFSVAVTLGSSRKISAAAQAASGADAVAGRARSGGRRRAARSAIEVGVDAAAADDVAARRGQTAPRRTAPAAGPASRMEARIRRHSSGSSGLSDERRRVDGHRVGGRPVDLRAEVLQQRQHDVHVDDVRQVAQGDRSVRQQRRRQHRQGLVLVPRRRHLALRDVAPADIKVFHAFPRAARIPASRWRQSSGIASRLQGRRRTRRPTGPLAEQHLAPVADAYRY